ncbi:ABC transporter ATP-binding protein [Millisia brevis]|uniref:ABC transporter ATP-binding protein n=1 Tax=Millisia brevis TaxID=264148 RepID=UPI00083606CA|nr:ABC transporter ATP-binding protein [Millisia brevis]
MIRTVWNLLPAGSRGRAVTYGVLSVLSVVLRAAGVVALVPLIGALFTDAPGDALPWLGVLTACTLLGWVVDARTATIGFDLGFTLLDTAQHAVADRLGRVPMGWFTAPNTAKARQTIAASGPQLVQLFAYLLTPLIQAVLVPVAIGLALLAVSWPLGLVALAGVPLLLGALWASGRLTANADAAASEANAALTERVIEFARTQQALRAARRVEPERSHAGAALDAQHGRTMRLLLLQIPGQILFSVVTQIALIALAVTTVVLTVRGSLTIPEAIALIVVIVRYLEPFAALGDLAPGVQATAGTLAGFQAVLDASDASEANPSDTPITGGAAPAVELRDVTFGYGDDAPVLDGLSVTFAPGSTTAIVGPSGAGKSTVLGLIAGLTRPGNGTVLIDGQSTDAAAHPAVSMVFQHPYLFAGTIRENVAVGDPSADPQRFDEALGRARVDEIVSRLPDGLDAQVGEAGSALSGGERQRVSIARALLKPAPILLIDEATSALDTENEAAVVAALDDDRVARTTVVVAHRLETIRGVDRVLFLRDGGIVEDGSVAQLLDAGGEFAEFWRQRVDAAGWRIGPIATAD